MKILKEIQENVDKKRYCFCLMWDGLDKSKQKALLIDEIAKDRWVIEVRHR